MRLVLKAVKRVVFQIIRTRRFSIFFWFHFTLFHMLWDLALRFWGSVSRLFDNIASNSARTSWHPWTNDDRFCDRLSLRLYWGTVRAMSSRIRWSPAIYSPVNTCTQEEIDQKFWLCLDGFEFRGGIQEFTPDIMRKLWNGDNITDSKAEAHRDIQNTAGWDGTGGRRLYQKISAN